MRVRSPVGSWCLALAVAGAAAFPVGCSVLAGDTEVVPGDGKGRDGGGSTNGQGNGAGGAEVGGVPVDPTTNTVVCDPAAYPGATVEAALALYTQNVHPLILDDDGVGCIGCHDAKSARQFKVAVSAEETFHNARAGGFFDNKAGGLLGKILNADPTARMPQKGDPWAPENNKKLRDVVCTLAAVPPPTPGGPLPDEQFPPALLGAYAGPSLDTYDNTFLVYAQLRAKIKSIFGEEWVRGGVDKFTENLALFGGVDFQTRFVEARVASPDFLLGMDSLSKDVCGDAVKNKTGPFAGLDTNQTFLDIPDATSFTWEAEDPEALVASVGQKTKEGWMLYANGNLATKTGYVFPVEGKYRFTVKAYGSLVGGVGPTMDLQVDGLILKTFTNIPVKSADYVFEGTVPAGTKTVAVAFTNDANADGEDRNLTVDSIAVEGPLGGTGGTEHADAAKAQISTLYERMLYRKATAEEQTQGLSLIADIHDIASDLPDAWAGLCEGILQHPDFLFTLPPSRASSTDPADKNALLLVKITLDLTGRPPTAKELADIRAGARTIDQAIDTLLASEEFRSWFFYKMRLRTESDGSTEADEPARLWAHLLSTGKPFQDLLVGEYSVDEKFQQVARPAVHGKTGVLTMKGFLKHKPGLPHYNYPARVMTDFMGSVFQVPPEVLDQRGLATAATTVEPGSLCFSCHQILTPLAHQRLRWTDEGEYVAKDQMGKEIDDSDRGMVADYPYKGQGLEAFSTVAARKEAFVRQTLNAEYLVLMGRPMRAEEDERVIYKALWDAAVAGKSDLRKTLKAILQSPTYQEP
jgi:hypothetical protein